MLAGRSTTQYKSLKPTQESEMAVQHGSELAGLGQDYKAVRKQIAGGVKRLEAKKAAREF